MDWKWRAILMVDSTIFTLSYWLDDCGEAIKGEEFEL